MRQKYKKGKQGKPDNPQKRQKVSSKVQFLDREVPSKPERQRQAKRLKRAKSAPKRKATELDEGGEGSISYPPGVSEEDAKKSDEYRKKHRVAVKGPCPPPFESFTAAQDCLGADLIEAMYDEGYDAPTPIQAQAWPVAANGQDLR